jgi:hypothetical protein
VTDLAHTSVPRWFTGAPEVLSGAPGVGATSYLLIGVGETAITLLRRWRHGLGTGVATEVVTHEDVGVVAAALAEALGRARVGLRLRLAGPSGACLSLRGMALQGGLEDDEITVVITGPGPIEVSCTHCLTVTSTSVGIGDVTRCVGCQRNLLVYHHVSRRSGRFMGFMVDAEKAVTSEYGRAETGCHCNRIPSSGDS